MGRRWHARLAAFVVVGAIAVLALSAGVAAPDPSGGAASGGFQALSGAAAAAFQLPGDVELVKREEMPALGLTYERYQQVYGAAQAKVYGGQLTLYRDSSGAVATVIGAHYPGIVASNSVGITKSAAVRAAERDLGTAGERLVDLLIDPASGRYFYRVETRGFDTRWVHWIDAGNGAVIQRYDAIAHGSGTGVKGDPKTLTGLTTLHNASGHGATGAHYDLFSQDNRQKTYDARNGQNFLYYVTDADDVWDKTGRTSPGHPALVDAQYYANVADDYFASLGLNFVSTCYPAGMQSVAHYKHNYDNAFWSGTYVVYGDGDGTSFREFSGGLDVVAHEYTHAVTDCFSKLVYQGESGALNEAFSDMLGNSAEFFYGSEPTDWFVAEDVYLTPDTAPGFRNMRDPEEDGDPDHYSERYTGTSDNGGVHTNSGIPNHAYYLLVNGGMNASCAAPSTHNSAHCTPGSDLVVPAIGLAAAQSIFYLGFTALPENATMCDARDSTVAVASAAQQDETLHVGALAGSSSTAGKNWKPAVTITVHDGSGSHNPVQGVTVTGTWTGAVSGTSSCTTGTSGTCSVSRTTKTGTTVTFTVDSLALSGFTYDASANDVVPPSITINK